MKFIGDRVEGTNKKGFLPKIRSEVLPGAKHQEGEDEVRGEMGSFTKQQMKEGKRELRRKQGGQKAEDSRKQPGT